MTLKERLLFIATSGKFSGSVDENVIQNDIDRFLRIVIINVFFLVAGAAIIIMGINAVQDKNVGIGLVYSMIGVLIILDLIYLWINIPFMVGAAFAIILYGIFCGSLLWGQTISGGDTSSAAYYWIYTYPIISIFTMGIPGAIPALVLFAQVLVAIVVPVFAKEASLNVGAVMSALHMAGAYFIIMLLTVLYELMRRYKDRVTIRLNQDLAERTVQARNAQAQAEAANREITAMKDNLNIGIFFLNEEGIIQDRYSKALGRLLDVGECAGKNFLDLLKGSVLPSELEAMQDYFDMVRYKRFSDDILEDINPMNEFPYVSMVTGARKIFQAHFTRVDLEQADIPEVPKVTVTEKPKKQKKKKQGASPFDTGSPFAVEPEPQESMTGTDAEVPGISDEAMLEVQASPEVTGTANPETQEKVTGTVTMLMVSLYDITVKVELEKELAAEKERQEEEMRSMFELLSADAAAFADFIEDANHEFSAIDGILKHEKFSEHEKLVEIYKSVHAVKSNAVILGLATFGEKVHRLESIIKNLREKQEIPFNDMLRLTMEIENIAKEKEGFKQTIAKIDALRNDAGHKTNDNVLVATLERAVARASEDLGKKADFVVDGIDVAALERGPRRLMKEVLLQLVRNSVVHGIEPPEERVAQGKPERGSVHLLIKIEQESPGLVHLRLRDDGAGINFDKILEKGLATGYFKAGEAPDKNELLNAIFSPGFSTAEEETMHGGRGVGLNIVRDRVQAAGGTLKVQTAPTKGTAFHLYLPL